MPNKLYFYSDLKGTHGWAIDADNFRELYATPNTIAVRVAHKNIDPPDGYEKTGDELAHQPAVKVAPKVERKPRYEKLEDFIGSDRT